MFTAALVIAILVFLIVVHELGHFIAAKIFGVKVTEFGVGYPPRAFTFGRIGETEYTLNWIPFGGFVRLFGEDEGAQHGQGSFIDSPRWKQAVILLAGVAMNAIAAWALFTGAYTTGILHITPEPGPGVQLMVTDIVDGSPAYVAGIQAGNEIVSLVDAKTSTQATLTPEGITEFVSERAGRELEITYTHAGTTTTTILRPAHAVIEEEAGRPAIGIGLALVTSESLPLGDAAVAAYARTKATFSAVGAGLWSLASDAARGEPNLKEVVGPVGLVSVVGEASENGWGYVLSLAAFISVNLTIINLIPIPALDGGRLVLVAIESVMRRQAPKLAVQILNTIGIAFVILLMVTVTYNDIVRLFA